MGKGSARMTRQRRVILEELAKLKTHPTADELYRIVRRRVRRISLSTVYRNLDILARAGTIHKIDMAGAQARFDGDVSRHYHLRCTKCGRVDDSPAGPLPMIDEAARQITSYEIVGHRLEFLGICPACKSACEKPPERGTVPISPRSAPIVGPTGIAPYCSSGRNGDSPRGRNGESPQASHTRSKGKETQR
jgi:Fur family ferric uptake transcriptional regulator